jgi:hypothetical protein
MSALISTSLAVAALLVLGYILGTEWCLPAARYALRTGDMESWRLACRLVAAGEWAIIVVCASLLLTMEQAWHLFTAMEAGKVLGLSAAGLLLAVVCWEVAGRSRKHYAGIMSTTLDLALPESGARRELYERLHLQLETGSRAAQQRVLQALLVQAS